jgi:hypothetical protein
VERGLLMHLPFPPRLETHAWLRCEFLNTAILPPSCFECFEPPRNFLLLPVFSSPTTTLSAFRMFYYASSASSPSSSVANNPMRNEHSPLGEGFSESQHLYSEVGSDISQVGFVVQPGRSSTITSVAHTSLGQVAQKLLLLTSLIHQ